MLHRFQKSSSKISSYPFRRPQVVVPYLVLHSISFATATSNTNNIPSSMIGSHYAENTSNYEQGYFYSSANYTKFLQTLVQRTLDFHPVNRNPTDNDRDSENVSKRRRLLDLGGGTGLFTRKVMENVRGVEAVVVDPFLSLMATTDPSIQYENGSLSMKEPNFNDNPLQLVNAGGESFMNISNLNSTNLAWWQQNYDQVLIKEAVHHFHSSDRVAIFQGLRHGLRHPPNNCCPDRPSLLIVTRPQYEIDYPIWPEVRTVWAKNQPSLEDLVSDLQSAGFPRVESSIEAYPCRLEVALWLNMIRNRFWSTFSHFSDDEIETGCTWIVNNYVNTEGDTDQCREENMCLGQKKWLEFEDRFLLIQAFIY